MSDHEVELAKIKIIEMFCNDDFESFHPETICCKTEYDLL